MEIFLLAILFIIAMSTLIIHPSLIKKIIALNIVSTCVVLLFVFGGKSIGNNPPIDFSTTEAVVDPMVHSLMLTAIVINVCVTSFSLALVVHIYSLYKTFNIEKIEKREIDE